METLSSHYCCSFQTGETDFVSWYLPYWTAMQDCFSHSHRRLELEHGACLVSSGHHHQRSVSSESFLIFGLEVAAVLKQKVMALDSSLGLIRWNRWNVGMVE